MDALLKEKSSVDQHDLESNPTGKPEAEGPAGVDAKVRKSYRAHMAYAQSNGFVSPFAVLFVHDLSYLTNSYAYILFNG